MKPIARIPLAFLVTAAVVSLGMVGVHASEQCVRFVQKKVHHHISAATAARWAAWDKAHPNWHPRPRPIGETMAALDFACSVPLIQKPVEGELPPIDLNGLDFPMDMLPPPETPVVLAMVSQPPVFESPSMPMVSPPISSPEYPNLFGTVPPPHVAPPGMTPEPSTWMLLGTAALAILSLGYRRRLIPATAPVRRR